MRWHGLANTAQRVKCTEIPVQSCAAQLPTGDRAMEDAQFWKMIDESRKKSRGVLEDQLDLLEASVKQLTPDEIVEFDRTFSKYMSQAYTWDLWGAAYVIGGGCGNDGFEYFRSWLTSKGR